MTSNPYWIDERYTASPHRNSPCDLPSFEISVTSDSAGYTTQITGSEPVFFPKPQPPMKGHQNGLQNQETHHLEPPETTQENIKIEEEGKQMSSHSQRIDWDDLKPGDTIHVRGSSNTYTYKRGASHTCGLADSVWAAASPLRTEVVIDRYDFDYATRRPERSTRRHTRVQPPQTDGEYYLASSPVARENKLLMELVFGAKAYSRIMRVSNARNRWRLDLDGIWKEYATWGQLLGDFDDHDRDVTEAISAEEFYQRKYGKAA